MRWHRRRQPPSPHEDPEALEIIELDADGHSVDPTCADEDASITEVAYGRAPDPTSLAALWDALGHS